MIRRTSQNLRPPTQAEKEASVLALRLQEAFEKHKARNRQREEAGT